MSFFEEIDDLTRAILVEGTTIDYSTCAEKQSASGSLTAEDVREAIKLIKDESYNQKVRKQEEMFYHGLMLLDLAFRQEIITEHEQIFLLGSLYRNGVLVVTADMAKKLNKVKIPKELQK